MIMESAVNFKLDVDPLSCLITLWGGKMPQKVTQGLKSLQTGGGVKKRLR